MPLLLTAATVLVAINALLAYFVTGSEALAAAFGGLAGCCFIVTVVITILVTHQPPKPKG